MTQDPWATQAIGVTFVIGRELEGRADEVAKLGAGIREAVQGEVAEAHATLDFRFDEAVYRMQDLNRALDARQTRILQFVSHGTTEGELLVADLFNALDLTKENLAGMLRSRGVDILIVTACHGGAVARHLVDAGAVRVAIGINAADPISFAASAAFSTAFYGALARGRSIADAFESGRSHAAVRDVIEADRLEIFAESGAAQNEALLEPPDFYIIGSPSEAHASVVEKLRAALRPHTLFHEGDIPFGAATDELLGNRLEMAKVIMVLFEGQRMQNVTNLEQVARAVEKAEFKHARLFPLYLEGTRADNRVPFGLRRLQPAFLEDRRYRGDIEKLAKDLERLVPPKPARPA